jgi:GxxExxY protein
VLFEGKITEKIIESAIEVHRHLGPGLLESAYEECLCFELKRNDLSFERQKPLPLKYKSIELDCGYRIDILVEDKVIVDTTFSVIKHKDTKVTKITKKSKK